MSRSELDVVTDDTIEAAWGMTVADRVINPHATQAACNSDIASGDRVEGMIEFLEDEDQCIFWDGSAWRYLSGPPAAYKTADETVTSSTALQNDDHLSWPVAASAVYDGVLNAAYTAHISGGMKIDFTAPASATMEVSNYLTVVGGTTTFAMTGALGSVTGLSGTSAKVPLRIMFTLFTAGTAGTLQFRFAQQLSFATGTTVHKGSSLRLRRIG